LHAQKRKGMVAQIKPAMLPVVKGEKGDSSQGGGAQGGCQSNLQLKKVQISGAPAGKAHRKDYHRNMKAKGEKDDTKGKKVCHRGKESRDGRKDWRGESGEKKTKCGKLS